VCRMTEHEDAYRLDYERGDLVEITSSNIARRGTIGVIQCLLNDDEEYKRSIWRTSTSEVSFSSQRDYARRTYKVQTLTKGDILLVDWLHLRMVGEQIMHVVFHEMNQNEDDSFTLADPGRLYCQQSYKVWGVLVISSADIRARISDEWSMTCATPTGFGESTGASGDLFLYGDEVGDGRLHMLTQSAIDQGLQISREDEDVHLEAMYRNARPGDAELQYCEEGIRHTWLFRDRRVIVRELWAKVRMAMRAWQIISYIIQIVGKHQAAPDGVLGKRFARDFGADFGDG